MRKIPLLFSDSTFGTEEFGFISTLPGEDPDDADRRYEKHLRDQGVPARVDRMGNVVLERKTKVMKITESRLRQIIREEISKKSPTEAAYKDGWNDALVHKEPRATPSHPPELVDAYWDGYRDGENHLTRFDQLELDDPRWDHYPMSETRDYDPLGDSGTPHSGSRPRYALAFIDAAHGDRRLELVVHEEDTELAREVLKKMRRQGQRSGVQPTRQRFDPRDVTTREDLMRML